MPSHLAKFFHGPCLGLLCAALCLNITPAAFGQDAPQEAAAPDAAPSEATESPVPVTAVLLQWAPEQAQIAAALPPVNGLLERAAPLAKRLSGKPQQVDNILAKWAAQFAKIAGVEDAETFQDVARAKGIDFDAPAALYVDFSVATARLVKMLESYKKERAAWDAKAAEAGADASPTPEPSEEFNKALEGVMTLYKDPSLVLMLGAADPALAEASAKDLFARAAKGDAKPPESIPAGPVTITAYPDLGSGFFLHENWIAIGDIDLLQGVAASIEAPAELAYGTPACPAGAADEAAALFYVGRILPLYRQVAEAFHEAAIYWQQIAMMESMFNGGDTEEPAVITLDLNAEKLEILSRMDTAAMPNALKAIGDISPLRLAQVLPADTLAMLSIRFNDYIKQSIMDQIAAAGGAGGEQNPALAMQLAMIKPMIDMIGDELTLGVRPGPALFPQAVVMLGLAAPEAAQMFIGGMSQPSDTAYREIPISVASTPVFPVYLAVASGDLVAANDEALLKSTLDLLLDGKKTDYFSALAPPLNPKQPRFSAFVLDTEFFLGLLPLFSDTPDSPQAAAVRHIVRVIDQLRMLSEVRGTWQTSSMSLYFHPETGEKTAMN